MTRDEHRAQCIEAIKAAIPDTVKEALFEWWHRETTDWYLDELAVAAFDALHGIAHVNPIEATAEMLAAEIEDLDCTPTARDLCIIFDVMSAAGDLTDPPEVKP